MRLVVKLQAHEVKEILEKHLAHTIKVFPNQAFNFGEIPEIEVELSSLSESAEDKKPSEDRSMSESAPWDEPSETEEAPKKTLFGGLANLK